MHALDFPVPARERRRCYHGGAKSAQNRWRNINKIRVMFVKTQLSAVTRGAGLAAWMYIQARADSANSRLANSKKGRQVRRHKAAKRTSNALGRGDSPRVASQRFN